MPDDDKTKRAQEIDKAIKAHDAKKRDDGEVDVGTERASGGNGGEHLDKLLTALDVMGKRLDDAFKRMDDMEDAAKKRDDAARKKVDAKKAKRGDNDDGDDDDDAKKVGEPDPTKAKEVVADSTDPQNRFALLDAQAVAQKAYESWGLHAPKALYGEQVRDFETRLARGLQRHSKRYAKSDLESITDRAVWKEVLGSVYADAIEASISPDSIPPGRLRMKTERMPSGHLMNSFYGDPSSWMNQFAGARRFVKRISPKPQFDD